MIRNLSWTVVYLFGFVLALPLAFHLLVALFVHFTFVYSKIVYGFFGDTIQNRHNFIRLLREDLNISAACATDYLDKANMMLSASIVMFIPFLIWRAFSGAWPHQRS